MNIGARIKQYMEEGGNVCPSCGLNQHSESPIFHCDKCCTERCIFYTRLPDFDARVEAYYKECVRLQTAKRNDYTAGLSPFYNYEHSGSIMGVSAGLSMLGRLQEKVVRLSLALQGNHLRVNETISDACRDISILAGLISLWVEDQEGQ